MTKRPTKSLLRLFSFSILASLLVLVGVLVGLGPQALFVTAVLAIIEITFSFDNAIINARVLAKLPRPMQTLFLTVGILIAIFGMRIVFPILIVVLTAHLGWLQVVNLALHHPQEYARHLEAAHTSIAAFGGAFLLLLALDFFFDKQKQVHWLHGEAQAVRLAHWLVPGGLTVLAILVTTWLPNNEHRSQTLVAGFLGFVTFIGIDLLNTVLEYGRQRSQNRAAHAVLAAVGSLVYLEILDASFSFDGVIGAFAITSDVVLIAAGLGIGALWVRSLTIYMVQHETLGRYRYIEHGAFYTILVLAIVLLLSIVWNISDFVPGIAGLAIIGASIYSSLQYLREHNA